MFGQNFGRRRFVVALVAFGALSAVALSTVEQGLGQGLNLTLSAPQGDSRMTDSSKGNIHKIEKQADGNILFTHGHRFPDNVQTVEQHHNAQGRLQSAKVKWSGFAGEVLDVTATFDEQGHLVKEEGYRAPDMTTPIQDLLRPLPAVEPTASTSASTSGSAPSTIAEGLRAIYGQQG